VHHAVKRNKIGGGAFCEIYRLTRDDKVMPDELDQQVTKTEARQGTGPRQMVSVLFVSIALAVLAGGVLLWYFYFAASPTPA
jgi:hypothetical protein